jgi:hypothetical protein
LSLANGGEVLVTEADGVVVVLSYTRWAAALLFSSPLEGAVTAALETWFNVGGLFVKLSAPSWLILL